jgi:dolichol kinase
VAIGDGLGEFIGKPFGKRKYRITAPKSLEGSLGVFLGSFVGAILAFGVLGSESITGWILLVIILASLIAMIIEAVSISFLDNILMPWAVAGTLWFLI